MKFKICCIMSADEIDMAVAAGASAVGLVGEMPSGPGVIDDDRIQCLAAHCAAAYGDDLMAVLLTGRKDAHGVIDHVIRTGANAVQIVSRPIAGVHAAVRDALPEVKILQVVHVEDEAAVDEAIEASQTADYVLLDSGKPSAATPTLGGTGDVHDWSISRRIVERARGPVVLAGGLTPENVEDAVRAVRPYGVDVCSGLRDTTNHYRLETDKVRAFAAALDRSGSAPAGMM